MSFEPVREIRPYYEDQIQQHLALWSCVTNTNFDTCHFCQFWPSEHGREQPVFFQHRVTRDPLWIDTVRPAIDAFVWEVLSFRAQTPGWRTLYEKRARSTRRVPQNTSAAAAAAAAAAPTADITDIFGTDAVLVAHERDHTR